MYNYFNKFPTKEVILENTAETIRPMRTIYLWKEIANAYLSIRNTPDFINET